MGSQSICVVSLDAEEGKVFIKEACGMPAPAESGFTELQDSEAQLQLRNGEEPAKLFKEFDGAILLVHFMDLITVEKLRRIYRALEKKPEFNTLIAIYKGADEDAFKISCLECGQKIWVPDNRQGASGRCPKCKKSFELLTRQDHVRMVLGLVEGIPVNTVAEGDAGSFKRALETMVGLIAGREILRGRV